MSHEYCDPTPNSTAFAAEESAHIFTDVMLDIETMSLHPNNALVLSVGIIEFDPDREFKRLAPLFGERALLIPNRDEQLVMSREVSPGTQKFWRDLPQEARDHWERTPVIPVLSALHAIERAVAGKKYVWAHGIAFDISNIASLFLQMGREVPWHYQAPTDCRSILHQMPQTRTLKGEPDALVDFKLIKHNPLSDDVWQACAVFEHMARPEQVLQ